MKSEYIRGILVFLFILNKPIDKDQNAETFCESDCFSKSKFEHLQPQTLIAIAGDDASYECN